MCMWRKSTWTLTSPPLLQPSDVTWNVHVTDEICVFSKTGNTLARFSSRWHRYLDIDPVIEHPRHQIDHSICGPQADFFPPIAIVCLFVVLKYVLLRSLGDITLWISKSLWLKPPWFLLSTSVWTFSARLNFQFLLYSQTWNWCWPSLRLLVVTFPRLLNLAVFVGFNLQSKIFNLWLTYV